MDAILEDLPPDYAYVVSMIESKKRPPSTAEIEALSYGHGLRPHRYEQENQNLVTPSQNFTQGSYARSAPKGSY